MTLHKSLRVSAGLTGERNVWSRKERIEALKVVGRWKDGDSVLGLPKVRTRFKTKSKKKEKAADTPAAAGGAAPAAAAPAAAKAAAPAAKGKK
ncbi:MAG: small basic protein [Planctomycetota bacterium]